jgi:anti-sigma factor RsiW
MKNCEAIQALFDERLDGRLGETAQREFDGHVTACAVCGRQWREYAGAWAALEQHRALEPSFGFVERTLRRLDEEPAKQPVWSWLPVPARWAAAAAVALLLAGGWLVGQRMVDARRASLYVEIHQADYLEDYDVIENLDELTGGDQL